MARNAGGGETEGLENSSFSMKTRINKKHKITKKELLARHSNCAKGNSSNGTISKFKNNVK